MRSTRRDVVAFDTSSPLAMPFTKASSVTLNVGSSSGLFSARAYASHASASTTSSASLRTAPTLAMRSPNESGFSTTPNAPAWTGWPTRSGRVAAAIGASGMRDLALDGVGEQHGVDALLEE